MVPRQNKRLKPAKNGDAIGLADEKEKKFFKLNNIYLQVWLLCDGKNNEVAIRDKIYNMIGDKEIDKKELLKEIKDILHRLLKFGLIEQ